MAEIIDMKDDIVDWLLVMNIFTLIVGFFYFHKWLLIGILIINIILNGTFIVMSKFGDRFVNQINK